MNTLRPCCQTKCLVQIRRMGFVVSIRRKLRRTFSRTVKRRELIIIGISGNYLYYSSGFSSINRISNDGSGLTTLLSGYWVRSVAMDSTGIYFSDCGSKDVKKFDLNTSSLSTLISGNSREGGVVIDSNNVYFNLSGTMKKVSKSGGTVSTVTTDYTSSVYGMAVDDTYLYWGYTDTGAGKILRISKSPSSTFIIQPGHEGNDTCLRHGVCNQWHS